jgi:hypothetical protein
LTRVESSCRYDTRVGSARQHFDFATKHLHKVADLPGLSFVWGGMAVSRNNDALLVTGIDHGEADIILAEGFR